MINLTKPKILCVDDERDVLDSLNRLLRSDFDIFTAMSAENGLKIIDQHQDISIVLTDYHLPGISGGEFLRLVKTRAPNAVRAILSGQIDLQQMSDAINRAEVHRFILKPWTNEYLLIQMKESLVSHSILREQDRLRLLAITDPVTGLTNHRYFRELLDNEWENAKVDDSPLSLMMIDIDNFKACNDLYGHLIGDRVLGEVADRMNKILRTGESLSRYGGEEFSLLLPKTSSKEALVRAELIRQEIAKTPFLLTDVSPQSETLVRKIPVQLTSQKTNEIKHQLSVSIGLATQSPESDFMNPTHFVSAADSALYESKRSGRNKISVAKPDS